MTTSAFYSRYLPRAIDFRRVHVQHISRLSRVLTMSGSKSSVHGRIQTRIFPPRNIRLFSPGKFVSELNGRRESSIIRNIIDNWCARHEEKNAFEARVRCVRDDDIVHWSPIASLGEIFVFPAGRIRSIHIALILPARYLFSRAPPREHA